MYETYFETLRIALDKHYTANVLKRYAKHLQSRLPTRKMDVLDLICREMQGGALKSSFNALDDLGKSAVAETIHNYGGVFESGSFRAKYGKTPWDSINGRRSYYDEPEAGLINIFIVSRHVPDDLRERLMTFVPIPEKDSIASLLELPLAPDVKTDNRRGRKRPDENFTVRETAGAALKNLETMLRLADAGKLRVGPKTGRASSATLSVVSRMLDGGDWYDDFADASIIGPIQAFAWPLILQGGGLARAEGSMLKLSPSGRKALKGGDLAETIRGALNKWQKTRIIDEFNRVDNIKGQKSSRGRALTAPSGRRLLINEALQECPAGKWIRVEEFGRFMRANGFDYDVARDLWKLYIFDLEYGSLGFAGYGTWDVVEGRYLVSYLFEYVATMGLIDVAYITPLNAPICYSEDPNLGELEFLSRYDGLQYFRLNPLGAYALGLTDRYQAPPVEIRPVFKVLPNHEIVVTDKALLTAGDRLFMGMIAEEAASYVWRLTTQSILNAAEKGTQVSDIRTFLEARSGNTIPGTVLSLLDDAANRTTRLSYAGRAYLIACGDPFLVNLIASDTKLKKLCLAAGETHIAILPGKDKAFLSALTKLGYIVPGLREQL